jgi:anion-transporting  ArsA/GET3 family ATPase
MGLLRSPRTSVHLVTLLEEMPVQETTDAVAELRALDLPVGAVIVNQTRQPALRPEQLQAAGAGTLDQSEIAGGLKAAGLSGHGGLLDALTREAEGHAERVDLERSERKQITAIGLPVVELPWLADGVDLAGLYELSDILGETKSEVPW